MNKERDVSREVYREKCVQGNPSETSLEIHMKEMRNACKRDVR